MDKASNSAYAVLEHPEVTDIWPKGPKKDWAKPLLAFTEGLIREAADDLDVNIRELAAIIARGIVGHGRGK